MDSTKGKKAEKQIEEGEFLRLKEELEKVKEEIDANKNKYLRALADYQNLEKKISEERNVVEKWAVMKILLKLMPVVNNIEKAEVFVKDPGLKLVKENLGKTLKELGVSEIEVLGREFDPNIAEAVEIVPGEKDNFVVEILRRGYRLGERVLQVAQVKVSKKVIS